MDVFDQSVVLVCKGLKLWFWLDCFNVRSSLLPLDFEDGGEDQATIALDGGGEKQCEKCAPSN